MKTTMQHRLRSWRGARRSFPRSRHRDPVVGGGGERYCPSVRSKEEIFMRAGRLALEYLFYKGLLPPSSIRPDLDTDNRSEDIERREREHHRRYRDEDDDEERRRWRRERRDAENESDRGRERQRLKRKHWGDYEERSSSSRWLHERRRPRSKERDLLERKDHREHRSKKGSWRKKKEVWGKKRLDWKKAVKCGGGKLNVEDGDDAMSYESGEVREDDDVFGGDGGGSKTCDDLLEISGLMGGNGGGQPLRRYAIDLNEPASEGCLESDEEVGMKISGELKGKGLGETSEGSMEMEMSLESEGKSLCESEDFDAMGVKLFSFTNVSTKPGTSISHRSSTIDWLLPGEANKTVEIVSEVPKMTVEGDVNGFLSNSPMNQIDSSRGNEFIVSSIMPIQNMVEESVDQQNQLIQLLDQSWKSENVRVSLDLEMVTGCVSSKEKPDHIDSSLKSAPELSINIEVEKQVEPPLYKVGGINFMAPLETTVIQDDKDENDTVTDHLPIYSPFSEASRELSLGPSFMPGNMLKDTNTYCWLSGSRMIPLIDLEGDSTLSNAYDSTDSKIETTLPGMRQFIENDLRGSCSGSSVAISKFHQTDILGGSLSL